MDPVLLVIAGPNGAGKTTLTARLRQDQWSEGTEYLNPDDIARDQFGHLEADEATLTAARWTDSRREELLAEGRGIAFETVFSTQPKVDFLLRARKAGYFIRLFFVSTSDPRINAARVTGRMMEGGHSVPLDKILSRYTRSMGNLTAGMEIAHRAYIYDNSIEGSEAALCARTNDSQLRKIYRTLPQWVATAIDGRARHPEFVDVRRAQST